MQPGNLSGLIAKFNAGQVTAPEAPKAEKKPPAKRSQPSGAAKKNAKAPEAPAARPAAPAVAQALVAASLPGATPQDPNTAALGKRLKDVLECLLQRNGSRLTPAQIKELTGLNLHTDLLLLREMHRHPRITHQGAPSGPTNPNAPSPVDPAGWYSYYPEIPGVHNKLDLLNHVRNKEKGYAALLDALKLCYLRAAEDLEELRKEGRIFIIEHPEPGKSTVFVRDMMGQEGISPEVRGHWFLATQERQEDHVPQGLQELQIAVVRAGLRSALANQPIKRVLPGGPRERAKKPKKQRFNIEKATNAHLPSLFVGEQPKALDA